VKAPCGRSLTRTSPLLSIETALCLDRESVPFNSQLDGVGIGAREIEVDEQPRTLAPRPIAEKAPRGRFANSGGIYEMNRVIRQAAGR
jgi:hypothetical protein